MGEQVERGWGQPRDLLRKNYPVQRKPESTLASEDSEVGVESGAGHEILRDRWKGIKSNLLMRQRTLLC